MRWTCDCCGELMRLPTPQTAETCPGCGIVWEVGGEFRPTLDSLRLLVEAAALNPAGGGDDGDAGPPDPG